MFSDDKQSHAHSLDTLNLLDQFYDFKISIRDMLDLGCGEGYDLNFWANMDDGGEVPKPLDINCVGLDKHIVSNKNTKQKNVTMVKHDFNSEDRLPFSERKFDVVWCHDVLHYAHSPVKLLGSINQQMSVNSMLYLCVPSTINVVHHKFKNYVYPQQLNTFTMTQLIYLLALNGFDCKDAYFKKQPYEDTIEVITYKIQEPVDYTTSWYELDELELLSENMSDIINRIGYLTDNGLVTTWADGEVFDYRHHS